MSRRAASFGLDAFDVTIANRAAPRDDFRSAA